MFKPKSEANGEGALVWGKIHQKEISRDELDQHVSDGWVTSAHEALLAADIRKAEDDNADLKAQIADADQKIDLRTKEGRALKAQQDAAKVAE
ncbi:hypothetical protein WM40_23865 [Robbsia andropogonis]|uniref:Uncharacterized protein n=1 Tax=Robbsia andropogonis TaxID=28092 RepID=A0A0F5JVM4_9BURK|nr:hypothetical protein WM40_23865 [Robbsia andropogonis]